MAEHGGLAIVEEFYTCLLLGNGLNRHKGL